MKSCVPVVWDSTYPWDQSLVETQDTSTRPNRFRSLGHCLRPVRGHLSLQDLQRLSQSRDFLESERDR